jgi:hypothetical protein
MGTFRVEVQAVGGHGCQRELKDGEVVPGCGSPSCPDCLAREFVGKLRAIGSSFGYQCDDPNQTNYARITHWPGQSSAVVDDLLTGKRSGSF